MYWVYKQTSCHKDGLHRLNLAQVLLFHFSGAKFEMKVKTGQRQLPLPTAQSLSLFPSRTQLFSFLFWWLVAASALNSSETASSFPQASSTSEPSTPLSDPPSTPNDISTPEPTAAGSSAPGGQQGSLPGMVVSTTAPGESMLPTATPTESGAYGQPMNVLDIPRQLFPVNQKILQTEGAGTQGWFDPVSTAFLSPGSTAAAGNNLVFAPMIRGMPPLGYINGMQMTMQDAGWWNLPWNYNMVESMDVIEGPPNAVLGEFQPNGGAVNYITKQPYFDRFRGYVWDTTGMYENYLWGADIGGPIDKEKKIAYRFSYMGMENGSYYQYQYNDQQNFYLALSARPSDNYSVDFYSDFGTYNFNILDFMNRPTNELINNDLYQTGALAPSQVTFGFPPFNTYAGPLVPISLRSTAMNPASGAQGMSGMLQLVQNLIVNDDLRVRNNTFVFYIRSSLIDYAQWEDIDITGDYEVFNRTEVLAALHPEEALFEQNIDAGLEFGFQRNLDYEAVSFFGIQNAWSIVNPNNPTLANPYLWNAELSTSFMAGVGNPLAFGGGDWPIPSAPPGWYFEPLNGYSLTEDSQFWEVAPFYQHNIHFTDKLMLLVGGRATNLFISAQTPPGTPAFLSTSYDAAVLMPMVNVSPVYKPFPWMTAYFDFNWGYTSAVGVMGGYTPIYAGAEFRLVNQLIEGGMKFSLLKDKLYITTAGFQQNLYIPNVGLPPAPAYIKGFELALTYQPTKNFWARIQYLLANGTEDWSGLPIGPFQFQTYSTSTALAQGLPLNNATSYPPGKYAFVGWPDQSLTAMVTYQTNMGLGVTLSALVLSNQYLDYSYNLEIPTEYVINGRLFYTTSQWDFAVNIYNLTDNRHLWFPYGPGVTFGREMNTEQIVAGLPFWIQGTVAYRF
ncbi:TonB-dependent receptor [Candidatus Methylacidiphilum infernorum]|nr:TonB-dependent receptor [Candidatus Methylacidiphilum infernorum]